MVGFPVLFIHGVPLFQGSTSVLKVFLDGSEFFLISSPVALVHEYFYLFNFFPVTVAGFFQFVRISFPKFCTAFVSLSPHDSLCHHHRYMTVLECGV